LVPLLCRSDTSFPFSTFVLLQASFVSRQGQPFPAADIFFLFALRGDSSSSPPLGPKPSGREDEGFLPDFRSFGSPFSFCKALTWALLLSLLPPVDCLRFFLGSIRDSQPRRIGRILLVFLFLSPLLFFSEFILYLPISRFGCTFHTSLEVSFVLEISATWRWFLPFGLSAFQRVTPLDASVDRLFESFHVF